MHSHQAKTSNPKNGYSPAATSGTGLGLQFKLAVGAVNDPLEKEADDMADRVMRMPEAPLVRRKCAECEEEDERLQRKPLSSQITPFLQAKAAEGNALASEASSSGIESAGGGSGSMAGQADAPASVNQVLASPGRPLEPVLRQDMEQRFGSDFSGVQVHTDAAAEQSAQEVNAHAYTVGQSIVFGAGQFAPGMHEGRRLIAHELVHVIQQSGIGNSTRQSMAEQGTKRLVPLSAQTVQRQPLPPVGKTSAKPMTRAEEIQISFTSPGEITGTLNPPMISLYNFAIDQPTLKKEHLAALQAIAFLIKLFSGAKVRVDAKGHADSTGDDTKVNQSLSENRALSVQKVLQSAAGAPVAVSHCGELCPVTTNDTVEGRSRNRRVDINVFSGKKPDDIDWPSLCSIAPALCLCLKNPTLCR